MPTFVENVADDTRASRKGEDEKEPSSEPCHRPCRKIAVPWIAVAGSDLGAAAGKDLAPFQWIDRRVLAHGNRDDGHRVQTLVPRGCEEEKRDQPETRKLTTLHRFARQLLEFGEEGRAWVEAKNMEKP